MNKGNLVLHCGAHAVDLDLVQSVATPIPTDTHFPIPHFDLYSLVNKQITEAGFNIIQEQHALHTQGPMFGANYFSLLEIGTLDNSIDYNLIIGLRNSHVFKFSASIAIGSRVFVCDNLAFSGEVKIARKHTKNIFRDLPQCVSIAVGRINNQKITQDTRLAAYKETTLTQTESDHLVIELLRNRAVRSCDVIPIITEFEKPTHEEHLSKEGKPTVWTLFNSVTENTKGSNIFTLSKRTQALHGVCDLAAGIFGKTLKQEIEASDIGDAEYMEVA